MNIGGFPIFDALNYSPVSLSGVSFVGAANGSPDDFGFGSDMETLFNMGTNKVNFVRPGDGLVQWGDLDGPPAAMDLNKPGWYVKGYWGLDEQIPMTTIGSQMIWYFGGVYDGPTVIDPGQVGGVVLTSSGENPEDAIDGDLSVFIIRQKNINAGEGDCYNIYGISRKIKHGVVDQTQYSFSLFGHIYPGAIETGLDFILNPDPEPEPEPPGGDETTPGSSEADGYRDADPDDTSDVVPIPDDPTIGITDAGFINVYNPAAGTLSNLGNVIFPNVASATDVPTAIKSLCDAILNQNLINYVIDVHVIPCAPVVGMAQNIRVGFRDTGISAPVVTSDYVNVTCGSLNLHEYFANFADYLYTRSKLWLPFVGFVDMRPEFWQAGTIYVDYKFNVIDGSFMAYIRSTSSKSQLSQSVIASYGGNACMHFPLTGVNYSNMVSGVVGAAAAIATGGTSAAVLGAAASAANTICQGGEVQQSNGYNSTASLLGVRTPYLMIERPAPSYPRTYKHDRGFPSNITVTLGNISGYTEIEKIDLSGIPLTEQELSELRSLLSEGVYF